MTDGLAPRPFNKKREDYFNEEKNKRMLASHCHSIFIACNSGDYLNPKRDKAAKVILEALSLSHMAKAVGELYIEMKEKGTQFDD